MERKIKIKIYLASVIFLLILAIGSFIFFNSSDSIEIKPEYLLNNMGALSNDPSLGQYVRGSNGSAEGFLAYGPYISLPKGNYSVSFFLKSSASDETERICCIDVHSLSTHPGEVIVSKDLYGSDFTDEGGYDEFKVQFQSGGQKDLEFRVYKFEGASRLELSRVVVQPEGGGISGMVNGNIVFLAGIIAGIIVLLYLAPFYAIKYGKYLNNIIGRPSFPKVALIVFLIYATLIVLSSASLIPALQITGDEPHYLIIAQSIINDHDIYVKNNYDSGDYRPYYPGDLGGAHFSSQTVLAQNGQYISIHGIGLPILLSLPFLLGNVLGVKIFLAAVGGLACGLTYLLLIKIGSDEKTSALVALFVSACSPVLFYSMSIYTEIIGLFIILYLLNLLLDMLSGKPAGAVHYVIAGTLAGLLPFLGIKYMVLTFSLFIILAYFLISGKAALKKISGMLLPALVALSIYLYFHYSLFGSLDPTAMYKGVSAEGGIGGHDILTNLASVFMHDINILTRSFMGSFFDQQIGLIFYSPVYLLFFIGMAAFVQKNKWNRQGMLLILALTVPFFFMYTFGGSWGGYCPPARIFVPILGPIVVLMAIGMEYMAENKYRFTTYLLIALSLSLAVFMLMNPATLYNNLYYRDDNYHNYAVLFDTLNPHGLSLQSFFPSFRYGEPYLQCLLSILWLLIFALVLLANDLISAFAKGTNKQRGRARMLLNIRYPSMGKIFQKRKKVF
jgi:hypothetical protein